MIELALILDLLSHHKSKNAGKVWNNSFQILGKHTCMAMILKLKGRKH